MRVTSHMLRMKPCVSASWTSVRIGVGMAVGIVEQADAASGRNSGFAPAERVKSSTGRDQSVQSVTLAICGLLDVFTTVNNVVSAVAALFRISTSK